jgi:hypothetical protein
MVLLFEAAGVKSTADLVTDAAGLMTAVTSASKTPRLGEAPTEPQLADWIGRQAAAGIDAK